MVERGQFKWINSICNSWYTSIGLLSNTINNITSLLSVAMGINRVLSHEIRKINTERHCKFSSSWTWFGIIWLHLPPGFRWIRLFPCPLLYVEAALKLFLPKEREQDSPREADLSVTLSKKGVHLVFKRLQIILVWNLAHLLYFCGTRW